MFLCGCVFGYIVMWARHIYSLKKRAEQMRQIIELLRPLKFKA